DRRTAVSMAGDDRAGGVLPDRPAPLPAGRQRAVGRGVRRVRGLGPLHRLSLARRAATATLLVPCHQAAGGGLRAPGQPRPAREEAAEGRARGDLDPPPLPRGRPRPRLATRAALTVARADP